MRVHRPLYSANNSVTDYRQRGHSPEKEKEIFWHSRVHPFISRISGEQHLATGQRRWINTMNRHTDSNQLNYHHSNSSKGNVPSKCIAKRLFRTPFKSSSLDNWEMETSGAHAYRFLKSRVQIKLKFDIHKEIILIFNDWIDAAATAIMLDRTRWLNLT